jgi:hypothetical protein
MRGSAETIKVQTKCGDFLEIGDLISFFRDLIVNEDSLCACSKAASERVLMISWGHANKKNVCANVRRTSQNRSLRCFFFRPALGMKAGGREDMSVVVGLIIS